jgi:hypothetical protein
VFPEEKLSFEFGDYSDSSRVMRDFYEHALDREMFDFILEFHTLFPTVTLTLNESILNWYEKNDDNDSIPMWFRKFVISIKRKALWENNREWDWYCFERTRVGAVRTF